MYVKIYGIQRAQAAMEKTIAAVKPRNGLGAAVKGATIAGHRYAVGVTHVDTGALRASHTMQIRGAHGQIYISPSARRSDGGRPAQYGPVEHARGGAHAFYARTVSEGGGAIGQAAMRGFRKFLP